MKGSQHVVAVAAFALAAAIVPLQASAQRVTVIAQTSGADSTGMATSSPSATSGTTSGTTTDTTTTGTNGGGAGAWGWLGLLGLIGLFGLRGGSNRTTIR